jgi:molybdenum cofactor guanylyltransferase
MNTTPEIDLSVSAIVLAGGKSSRMGQDKALLIIQGVPLLRRVYDVARQCAAEVYVVTPWQSRYQSVLPDTCQFISEIVSTSDGTPHGPLPGFAQGLALIQTEWVLLLACDLPYLQVSILQAWVSTLAAVDQRTIAALPRHQKGWNPLCGFYRQGCLSSLNQFIAEGGRSFQHWLANQPVQELLLTAPQMLFNCNTPADLAIVENSTLDR